MKIAIKLASVIFAFAAPAHAGCIGSSSYQTCYDDSGNSYTVNRMGNSTYTQGYNPGTGSTWSQNSHTYGNTTQHFGTTNGSNWSMTQQQNSFGQTFSGTDADGNSFYKTCDSFGNCY